MIALLLALAGAGAAERPDPPDLWQGQNAPFTAGAGHGVAGVLGPARVGVARGTELRVSGLWSLVAPHVGVEQQLVLDRDWSISVGAHLGVPTMGLRLLQGTLLPSRPDIPLAATGGLELTAGLRAGTWVVSAGLEGRAAATAGPVDLRPTDLPFLDPMLAPLVEGPTASVTLAATWLSDPNFVLDLVARGQVGGLGPDLDGWVAGTWRVTRHLALHGGVALAWERFAYGRGLHAGPIADLRIAW